MSGAAALGADRRLPGRAAGQGGDGAPSWPASSTVMLEHARAPIDGARPGASTSWAPAATSPDSVNISTMAAIVVRGDRARGRQARQPGGLVASRLRRRARGARRRSRPAPGPTRAMRRAGGHRVLLRPGVPPGHAARRADPQRARHPHGLQHPGSAGQPGAARRRRSIGVRGSPCWPRSWPTCWPPRRRGPGRARRGRAGRDHRRRPHPGLGRAAAGRVVGAR